MSAQCWEAFFWNVGVACNLPQQWEYLYRAPAFLPQLAFNSPLVSICIVFCLRCHWRYVPSDFFFPLLFYSARQGFVVSVPFPHLSMGSVILKTRLWKLHTAFLLQTVFNLSLPKVFFFFLSVCSQVKSLCRWLHGEMSNCLPSCWEFLIDLSNKCSVIVLGSHVQHGATALMPSVPAHILSWTSAWF